MQRVAVRRPQHRTAAGGQHDALAGGEIVDHILLDIAERGLAVGGEVVAYRHADAVFDFAVAVDEAQPQLARQVTTHRRLATAGHADE